jgi:UDP-glucose 4-epimerase
MGYSETRADPCLRSGTGYIGSFTTVALLEHGYDVVIVDSLYNSSKVVLDRIELITKKRPSFYEIDVTDEAGLDKVFKEHPQIDSVIHFAALKVSYTAIPSRIISD